MPQRSSASEPLTLADLVLLVDELTASPQETALVVEHLLRTGRVRLRAAAPPAERAIAPEGRVGFLQSLRSSDNLPAKGRPRAADAGAAEG